MFKVSHGSEIHQLTGAYFSHLCQSRGASCFFSLFYWFNSLKSVYLVLQQPDMFERTDLPKRNSPQTTVCSSITLYFGMKNRLRKEENSLFHGRNMQIRSCVKNMFSFIAFHNLPLQSIPRIWFLTVCTTLRMSLIKHQVTYARIDFTLNYKHFN